MFLNAINKIYIKIFIIMLSFVFYGCKSVNNTDKNRDIPVDIYVGDQCGYWKNGERVEFPFDRIDLKLHSFLVSGKDIYAGGTIVTSRYGAGYDRACLLKNGKKIPLTYLCNYEIEKLTDDSRIWSIAISGNDIYAGGYNITCSGLERAGYWKNGKWIGLKPVNSKENSGVYSITIYNGDIYASGYSKNSGITVAGYWKNGEWVRIYPPDDLVKRLGVGKIVIHDDIYVIGYCVYDSKIRTPGYGFESHIPGYWKNGEWVKLGDNGKNVRSLFIDGNDVYVGGYSGNAFTKNIAGYWKNGKWIELKTPNSERDSLLSSIVVHNGDIYAAGMYKNDAGYYIPCYWKNGKLITLSHEAERDSYVTSIIVVDKE